jgi:lipoprotein signal peptidase
MSERSYRVLVWVFAVLGLAADQASKYGVFSWLQPREFEDATYVVFRDQARGGFQLIAQYQRELPTQKLILVDGRPVPHVNHGALFGLFRDHKTAANAAFALISLLAAAAIIYWSYQKNTARDRWLCTALGLILAGTLGNLYDRLVFNGVRDFLHWDYYFNWPVFNVADSCLVCGACLLLLQAFTPQTAAATAPEGDPAVAAEPCADLAAAEKG